MLCTSWLPCLYTRASWQLAPWADRAKLANGRDEVGRSRAMGGPTYTSGRISNVRVGWEDEWRVGRVA